MTHITVEQGVSKGIMEMAAYFDMFLSEIIEADKITGENRESEFVGVACKKFKLFSEESAIALANDV